MIRSEKHLLITTFIRQFKRTYADNPEAILLFENLTPEQVFVEETKPTEYDGWGFTPDLAFKGPGFQTDFIQYNRHLLNLDSELVKVDGVVRTLFGETQLNAVTDTGLYSYQTGSNKPVLMLIYRQLPGQSIRDGVKDVLDQVTGYDVVAPSVWRDGPIWHLAWEESNPSLILKTNSDVWVKNVDIDIPFLPSPEWM